MMKEEITKTLLVKEVQNPDEKKRTSSSSSSRPLQSFIGALR
jgi:hypothetical protein